MNSERIKEIQEETAYPNSVSVHQALLKVWNECSQQINKNCLLSGVNGCFIINNEKTPTNKGRYKVIHTDGIEGIEYFDGNCWSVEHNHPVQYWFFTQ